MSYFDEFAFEQGGRLYRLLGVRTFKRFASSGDYSNRWRRRSDPGFRVIRSYGDAVAWEARTRFNEAVHLASLLLSAGMVVWLATQSRYSWLPVIAVLNVVLNVFPILLQRYNRSRIRRVRALRRAWASRRERGEQEKR
jgi:hypothetical protein